MIPPPAPSPRFSLSGLPVWGTFVALVAGIALALTGAGVIVSAVLVAFWLATLWLYRPEPVVQVRVAEDLTPSRQAMIDLIEPFGVPVLMLDRQRIAAANAAARDQLGRHVIGQDARVALRHPEAITLLDLREGSVTVRGLTGPRSIWQVRRVAVDDRFSLIELVDRTAEADISRAHTDFVANASHELRTPLASIIGYIETLADPDARIDAATTARFHATVLREAKRLQHLVEDLMSLSRIEAEKHDAPRDAIDIGQLAATIGGEMAATLCDRRIVVETEEATVLGDRQQLDQVIRNLVDNSMKYSDPSRAVELRVTRMGGEAVLSVTDHGEGIHPDHIPHLTRRFYRTDPGRSRTAGGTGLGLAIVKHIVERHRGRLDITSKLGVGTTVTIRLGLIAGAATLVQPTRATA